MYACSEAFHEAVANGNDQKAMLIFSDCVFTDSDINVDGGIEFHDYFNTEEDLSIGQALSNEISFGLFNDDRLLNDYAFGDFTATLGVLVRTGTYQQFGSVMIRSSYTGADYIGSNDYPYIRRNSVTLNPQPSFAVKSILIYDGNVWCFSDDGRYAVYRDIDGTNITNQNPLNAFMRKKCITWQGKGMCYNKNTRMLVIQEGGDRLEYEFVPLGVFTAERPKAPDVIQIDLTCYDQMQKFDDDMPSDAALGLSYPVSIGTLYTKLCNYVGVSYATASFINSGATIAKRPEDFDSVTMRDVIKWIAEAAGSNARFNRDGVLELAWLKTTGKSYTANSYSEFNPYWYETKKVTKLYNRSTHDGTDKVYGMGNEGYLIQDNPLLKGVN